MSNETNTTTNTVDMSDPFDVFMNLEDVNVNGKSGISEKTKAELMQEHKTYQEEKQNNSFDFLDEESADQEDSFNPDDYDFSMLDEFNPIFEDGDEAQETESKEETDNDDSRFPEDETDENNNVLPSADDYDDGYTLDYSDLVTLPDGREVTVQDMADRYLAQEDFDNRLSSIAQQEQNFEAQRKSFEEDLNLARLETDTIISSFDGVDWYQLSIDNPDSYAQNKPFYDDMIAKRNEINLRAGQLKAQREEQERIKFNEDAKASVQILKATIPNWSDALYSNILDHAIHDLGWSDERAQKEIDVGVIKALYNSMRLSEGQKQVERKAVIKRNRTATRSVSPSSSKQANTDSANKAYIAAKYNAGKMSQEEAFRFLED